MADAIPTSDMTKPVTPGPDVVRTATRPEKSPREKGSTVVFAGRALLWTAVMAVGLLTLAPIVRYASVEIGNQSLAQASDAVVRQKLIQPLPRFAPADYFETIGELAMSAKPAQPAVALRAMERAVAIDQSRAFAWANIAWLQTNVAGQVTPDAQKALANSMTVCTLCDPELVAWRFNFVLAHWAEIPEATRRRAFEQADMLRWKGDHAEFLAGMRIKSEAAGIPYAEYRDAVKTPVRNWELGPAPASAPASASGPAPALRKIDDTP
ncbi:MAG: hypothetical protein ABI740_01230 [Alphaproteobacteria bacterium]